jgi:hypothetical protein
VAKLVTLHHRRRGWAWVAVGSAIGLAVYLGIDASLFESLTGTAETLSVIPVFVLLALVLAGLTRPSRSARRAAFRTTRCTLTRIAIRRATTAAGCSASSCSS